MWLSTVSSPQCLALDRPPLLISCNVPATVQSTLYFVVVIHLVGKVFSSQMRKLIVREFTSLAPIHKTLKCPNSTSKVGGQKRKWNSKREEKTTTRKTWESMNSAINPGKQWRKSQIMMGLKTQDQIGAEWKIPKERFLETPEGTHDYIQRLEALDVIFLAKSVRNNEFKFWGGTL